MTRLAKAMPTLQWTKVLFNIELKFEGWCQGGELNSRPRAYESPALPLSYPGTSRRIDVEKAFELE